MFAKVDLILTEGPLFQAMNVAEGEAVIFPALVPINRLKTCVLVEDAELLPDNLVELPNAKPQKVAPMGRNCSSCGARSSADT